MREGPDLQGLKDLRAFFRKFDTYCVLSRKLGICHSGVIYENYNDHEEKDKVALARLLARHAPAYRDTLFVYWNHRPLTHDPFMRLLREAGFHVAEGRSLDDVRALLAAPAPARLASSTRWPSNEEVPKRI